MKAAAGVTATVLETVITRDQHSCVRCGRPVTHLTRGVAWSIHHRRPRGSGGTSLAWVNQPANLIVLCGSGVTGCHGWVEKNRKQCLWDGFLISRIGVQDSMNTQLQHALYGRVLLDNDGGWEAATEEGEWVS